MCIDPQSHRGIASKRAQVPKTNISNGKTVMVVGFGHNDELNYRYHKRASSNLKPLKGALR